MRGSICGIFLWLLCVAVASAHSARVAGLVLAVLPSHEVVIRSDSGATPTVRYRLAPDIGATTLHAGDRVEALVDDSGDVLDSVRVVPPASSVHPATLLVPGDRMPATRFIDQRGRPFALDDFRGRSVVLAFVYTRCRDAAECPLISAHFHQLAMLVGNGPYHLVEITLDPAYDRPAVLAKYGALFAADPAVWTLGTGEPAAVLDFARRFGIDPFADPRVGLIHTERTVLIDPSGKIVDFADQANWNAGEVLARLRASGGRPEGWFERLDYELSKAAVAICGDRVAGFSGLQDLAIVLAIFAIGAWVLLRVGRKIFFEGA